MILTAVRIAILSQRPDLYSTRRLAEAVRERGHRLRIVDYMRCSIHLVDGDPQLHYEGQPIEDVDAVVPRISASLTFYGTAIVRQLESMGVFVTNTAQAIVSSRDKLRAHQLLQRAGLAMPTTTFGHAPADEDVRGLIKAVGGPPVIVKLVRGTQGLGVVLAETQNAAESVIEAFRGLRAHVLVQEWIRESDGADLRCLVVGDQVVAAMMRKAPSGEFRSNLHRGGTATRVKLTPEERSMAIRAAAVTGLGVAGVDILRSKRGPLVIEVNSSPGLEGIEAVSRVDVAGAIIDYVAESAAAAR